MPGAVHARGDLGKSVTNLLKGISFSSEALEWVTRSLRESHHDERKFHDEAISKLQREHRHIQDRIDTMYLDKLDGRIDNDFFDRKAPEFRSEQCRLMRDIQAHEITNRCYVDGGLELAHRAHELFESQPPSDNENWWILYFRTPLEGRPPGS